MLLEDCLPNKTFASLRNAVSKGELLHLSHITKGWYVHNTNPKLYVNCKEDQVKYVQSIYPRFLLAITDLNSRYDLFVNKPEVLATIAILEIGSEVELRLENEAIPVAAAIRYIGQIDRKDGTYFGVEILVSKIYNHCF